MVVWCIYPIMVNNISYMQIVKLTQGLGMHSVIMNSQD